MMSYDVENTMFTDSCTHSSTAVSRDVTHRHIQNSSASHHETRESDDEWRAAGAGDLSPRNDPVC